MAIDDELENSQRRQCSIREGFEKINAIKFSPTMTKMALGYTEGTLKLF